MLPTAPHHQPAGRRHQQHQHQHGRGHERKRVIVRGQVQGVGFRYYARVEAEKLGISGFVQNHADGSVEAQIQGAAASIACMLDWLSTGPPGAQVDSLLVTDAALGPEVNFQVHGDD